MNLLHKELKIIDELKNNKIILSVFGLCSDDKDLLPNDWGEYLKRTSSSWKIVRLKTFFLNTSLVFGVKILQGKVISDVSELQILTLTEPKLIVKW